MNYEEIADKIIDFFEAEGVSLGDAAGLMLQHVIGIVMYYRGDKETFMQFVSNMWDAIEPGAAIAHEVLDKKIILPDDAN